MKETKNISDAAILLFQKSRIFQESGKSMLCHKMKQKEVFTTLVTLSFS